MTLEKVIFTIESALEDRLLDLEQRSEKRLYLKVEPEVIPDTAEVMSRTLEARLQTASGIDGPNEIEILYHWALDQLGLVVTVRTRIDREPAEIASITPICHAAEWIEREMWELLGINFIGHPDLRHLVLQDDWPEGQFPLRRDYRKK